MTSQYSCVHSLRSSTNMNYPAKIRIIALIVFLCSSCSSFKVDETLTRKRKEAMEISYGIVAAIDQADTDVSRAVTSLWDLCDQAEAFTESIFGVATPLTTNQYSSRYQVGWEYPSDVPAKYDAALWAPIYACSLHDLLREQNVSKTSTVIAQFRTQFNCLSTGDCEE
jgi:hypothetical protein